jgi:hypothetical protein
MVPPLCVQRGGNTGALVKIKQAISVSSMSNLHMVAYSWYQTAINAILRETPHYDK